MGLIWWLSDRQLPLGPEELLFPGADKLVHVVEYFVLAWLWQWAQAPGWRALALAGLITLAWGALDEWHQTWVPGRDGNLGDFAADAAGGLMALVSASARRLPKTP